MKGDARLVVCVCRCVYVGMGRMPREDPAIMTEFGTRCVCSSEASTVPTGEREVRCEIER